MARIITDYLDESARNYPDKTAFVDSKRSITFSLLQDEAYHIAMGLISLDLFKMPVAIFLDKSIECISAFLGVAYSGNFYTMIDTTMPSSRIEKIITTLDPKAIITDRRNEEKANAFSTGRKVLLLEDLMALQVEQSVIRAQSTQIIESDVMYVLFTSGSTGVPKGAITSHRAVIGYLEAVTEAYRMDADTIIGNQAPFYFVLSLIDIYCTIKNGGTTYLIPKKYFMFPGELMKFIAEHRITFLNWVSSALSVVANIKAFQKTDISCVKTVIFGGEVMPVKHLNAWMDALPDTVFINGYGSTEVTDSATYFIVNRRFKETDLLPLGIPLANTSILVLNDNNEPAGQDETGELCVRGNNLAYGYYNDPERTAKVFIQNPLNKAYKETIYRTGDIVRFNEYGEIEYIGRKDFQIKHMGHRIELGEIEVNVSSVDGVDENCCMYDTEQQKIILYYTGKIEDKELGTYLKRLLPVYMLPGKRIKLDTMPHNLNGKVDRAVLKEKTLE